MATSHVLYAVAVGAAGGVVMYDVGVGSGSLLKTGFNSASCI